MGVFVCRCTFALVKRSNTKANNKFPVSSTVQMQTQTQLRKREKKKRKKKSWNPTTKRETNTINYAVCLGKEQESSTAIALLASFSSSSFLVPFSLFIILCYCLWVLIPRKNHDVNVNHNVLDKKVKKNTSTLGKTHTKKLQRPKTKKHIYIYNLLGFFFFFFFLVGD